MTGCVAHRMVLNKNLATIHVTHRGITVTSPANMRVRNSTPIVRE